MPGETSLTKLLSGMKPVLHDEVFCYTSLSEDCSKAVQAQAVVSVREPEGLTLVLPRAVACDEGLATEGEDWAWITLQIHSSLEAIGLTAAFAHSLTRAGISCNVVAGYHHDHIFVPYDEGSRAVGVLELLAESAREEERNARAQAAPCSCSTGTIKTR